jgi:hypothetical protein
MDKAVMVMVKDGVRTMRNQVGTSEEGGPGADGGMTQRGGWCGSTWRKGT